jgi:hypothetical protein
MTGVRSPPQFCFSLSWLDSSSPAAPPFSSLNQVALYRCPPCGPFGAACAPGLAISPRSTRALNRTPLRCTRILQGTLWPRVPGRLCARCRSGGHLAHSPVEDRKRALFKLLRKATWALHSTTISTSPATLCFVTPASSALRGSCRSVSDRPTSPAAHVIGSSQRTQARPPSNAKPKKIGATSVGGERWGP